MTWCVSTLRANGPDSAESWLVALATWWTFIFSYAFYRSYSVLYLSLTRTHHLSRQDASTGFVALVTSSCLFGIIAGCLERRYSIRSINFVSSIVCALAALILYFDISKYGVFMAGTLYGLGRSSLGNLCTALVSRHFIRRRTAAMGFSYSGISLAGIIFPVILQFLIEEYGLRGCCLLLSGISLNACVGACFHREPSTTTTAKILYIADASTNKKASYVCKDAHHTDVEITTDTENSRTKTGSPMFKKPNNTFLQISDTNVIFTTNLEAQNTTIQKGDLGNSRKFAVIQQQLSTANRSSPATENSSQQSSEASTNFFVTYVLPVRVALLEGMFYVCLCAFFCLIILGIVFTILLDVAADKGVDERESPYILTVFAVADIISSLTVGLVSGSGRKRTKYTTMVVQIAGGLCVMSVTTAHGFLAMAAVAAGIGVTNGFLNVLVSVLLAEYLGKQLLPITMGLCMLFGGILSWLAPPLIGYYRDVQQNYDPLLLECGGAMVLTGFLWLLESYILSKSKLYRAVGITDSPEDTA